MCYKSAWELISEILKLSEAQEWEDAVTEWEIHNFYTEQDGTCLCSHYPITEHFVLLNTRTGEKATVGNVCVGHFSGEMKQEADLIFDGFERIKQDRNRSANRELIHYAEEMDFITTNEMENYLKIYKKKKLSDRERDERRRLNRKIIDGHRNLNRQERPTAVIEDDNGSVISKTSEESKLFEPSLSAQESLAQNNADMDLDDPNFQPRQSDSLLGHRRKLDDEANDLKALCGECSLCEEKCKQKQLKQSLCGHVIGCPSCWEDIVKKQRICSICRDDCISTKADKEISVKCDTKPFKRTQINGRQKEAFENQEAVKSTDPDDIQSTIGSYMSSILSRSVETISEGAEVVNNKAGELGKAISVGAEASIDKTNYGERTQKAILNKFQEIGNPLEGVKNTLSNVFNKLDPTETILEWLERLLDAQLEHLRQLIIEAIAKIETEWLKNYIDTQIETLQQFILNIFAQMDKRINQELADVISEIATSISNTVIETLWTIAYYLLGTYFTIKCAPFIIKKLGLMCFERITRNSRSCSEQTAQQASMPPYLELKGDQFKIEDLHVTVDRVPYNTSKCFLKFFLHYTVQHFNRDDGNVIILISTFVEDSLKQSHTVTIPATKFSISSVYKACSFREPIELDVEKVTIKVNILFKSNNRQTLSICKGVFDIVLKPLNTNEMQQSCKDSTVRIFIRMIYAVLESSVLFGSQPEKVLLISEMKKEEFAKS